MSFNKITIIGNLGRDPELRFTSQGTPVCSFSVAVNEKHKLPSGEIEESTQWFRVSVWNSLGETAHKYLTRGREVYVEGRLSVNEYDDRQGIHRFSLDIRATEVRFLGGTGVRPDETADPVPSVVVEPAPVIVDQPVTNGRGKRTTRAVNEIIPF